MDIMHREQTLAKTLNKADSIDIPDCFGEYNPKNKLCFDYCSISIRCCILQSQQPKMDILEKLLIQNQFAMKMN